MRGQSGKMQTGIVELDVHGMTKRQAKVFIESYLRKSCSGVYRLRIIHGFHGGTELRDMVRREISKNPMVKRIEIGLNPGETDLIIKELF